MKIILTIFFLGIFALLANAQGVNDMKARIEFEDAEKAYAEERYEDALQHLNKAEGLVGTWGATIGYLKIMTLDKITDYLGGWKEVEWDSQSEDLYTQVKKFMDYADANPEKIDMQKLREVSIIEESVKMGKQCTLWQKMPEFVAAEEAYLGKNYDLAMTNYLKAADKNNLLAYDKISDMYRDAVGVTQDHQKSNDWDRKAMEKGYIVSICDLGRAYQSGNGVPKDNGEALRYYLKASNKGMAYAMFRAGQLYSGKHDGITQNYDEAFYWLKIAACKGEMNALTRLGVMYQTGEGVGQDFTKAMSLFKKASEKGSSSAMNRIGVLYEMGNGVSKNYTEAMNWYKMAADQNFSTAMINIACLYDVGLGVSRDYAQAVFWMEKAEAAKYEFNANYSERFATCYYNIGNFSKAMEWYTKAHEHGHPSVKYKIALMYREGQGVPADKRMAKEWEAKP